MIGTDLVRVQLTLDSSTGSGRVQTWGHRASEIVFLHRNFVPWVRAGLTANHVGSLRSGAASVFFDAGNQPQEISVAGTVLTDALHNAVPAHGLDIRNSADSRSAPAVMNAPAFDSTTHYQLHTTAGAADTADSDANVRHYFVTHGTVLYLITLIHFNATSILRQLDNLLGIPNTSSVDRIVNVNGINSGASVLDFSADTGSYTGPVLQLGDIRLDGWPALVAENVAVNGNTWMTATTAGNSDNIATWNQTLEQLSGLPTRIYYYPTTPSQNLTTTDDIRTNIESSSSGDICNTGDLVASVVRFAPTAYSGQMVVTSVYAAASSFKITQITVSDPGMTFQLSWNNVLFTDKGTGETVSC